jgi:hypothetical protein
LIVIDLPLEVHCQSLEHEPADTSIQLARPFDSMFLKHFFQYSMNDLSDEVDFVGEMIVEMVVVLLLMEEESLPCIDLGLERAGV